MVAILVIGNELIYGQTRESNSYYLTRHLVAYGIEVREIRVIPDDRKIIIDGVRDLSRRFDFLITTGGIGPTHDDVTLGAIAEAFSLPLEKNQEYENFLNQVYGKEHRDIISNMAGLPRGSRLHFYQKPLWPLITVENCIVLPGSPRLIQSKIEQVTQFLPRSADIYLAQLYLAEEETRFAIRIKREEENHSGLTIGSYPIDSSQGKPYRTVVTIKGKNREKVTMAFDNLKGHFKERKSIVSFDAPDTLAHLWKIERTI